MFLSWITAPRFGCGVVRKATVVNAERLVYFINFLMFLYISFNAKITVECFTSNLRQNQPDFKFVFDPGKLMKI